MAPEGALETYCLSQRRCVTLPVMSLKKVWLRIASFPAAVLMLCTPAALLSAQPQKALQASPATFSMERDREPVVPLDGLWRFHPGDDPDGKLGWAKPDFDDSNWALITSAVGWSDQGYKNMGGMAWYRARVLVEDDSPLSLYIPYCYTSYEVYADGKLLGGLGGMPPA